METLYESLKGKGQAVVGVTTDPRGKGGEELEAYSSENEVTYPVAKVAGSMTEYSNVTGIPSAAIGHDGEIVWLDIPGILTEANLVVYL